MMEIIEMICMLDVRDVDLFAIWNEIDIAIQELKTDGE